MDWFPNGVICLMRDQSAKPSDIVAEFEWVACGIYRAKSLHGLNYLSISA